MTSTELHSLVLASGLPESKWPCEYIPNHSPAGGIWCHLRDTPDEEEPCYIYAETAILLFAAVLVEELGKDAPVSMWQDARPNTGEECWIVERCAKGSRYTVAVSVDGPTLIEALCAAYKEVHK